jgi:hypothetical protein
MTRFAQENLKIRGHVQKYFTKRANSAWNIGIQEFFRPETAVRLDLLQ